MLFFATTINYLDRQVLSLLQPLLEEQFHWTDNDYGTITAVFSLFYAISLLFAGRFVDRVGTKKGYAWAIAIWSFGAALHALCGIVTEHYVGLPDASALRMAQGADIVSQITMVSITAFVIAVACWLWAKRVISRRQSRRPPSIFPKKTGLSLPAFSIRVLM